MGAFASPLFGSTQPKPPARPPARPPVWHVRARARVCVREAFLHKCNTLWEEAACCRCTLSDREGVHLSASGRCACASVCARHPGWGAKQGKENEGRAQSQQGVRSEPPRVLRPADLPQLREALRGLGRGEPDAGGRGRQGADADADADSSRLVVLMCCTRACGPCRKFEPTFELFAQSYEQADFVKINADDCDEFKEFCTSLRVREVPAFRFFRSGKEVKAAQLYLMPPGLNAAEQILRQEILANL